MRLHEPRQQKPPGKPEIGGHVTPQAPQFCGSVRTLVHVPEQSVAVPHGLGEQTPLAQTSVTGVHVTPQAPQLASSVATSLQVPEQFS